MANWDNLGGGGNVEDRRGTSGLKLGGGATLLVVGGYIALSLLGVNLDPALLSQVIGSTGSSEQSSQFQGEDDYETFAGTVLSSIDSYWESSLAATGSVYSKPRLVLFRDATQSSCGVATADVGPHYCPGDQTIYLDERFFDQLKTQLGGSNGDVAQAYVIAHEAGHHIQNLNGTMERVQSDPAYQRTGENSLSVRLELQADCYAGLWAKSIDDKGVFGQDEVNEAIEAAAAVGDDRIQQQTTGTINPETWTHGSAAARVDSFSAGYNKGEIGICGL